MELKTRFLKLNNFDPFKSAELLLNARFKTQDQGGLVILVGENNVGKSNILEALKAFNDTDIKLCNENDDYSKDDESKEATLSLEEETSLNNKTIDFSCVDLKIQTKEIGEGLKELSKTLISHSSNTFVKKFIDLIISHDQLESLLRSRNQLESFLKLYEERLKLNVPNTESDKKESYREKTNLFFKELVKSSSGSRESTENFRQYIGEFIKHNAPNKEYRPDRFFIMGEYRQNQLARFYSRSEEFNERKIEPKDMEDILEDIRNLCNMFKHPKRLESFKNNAEVLSKKSQEDLSQEECKKLIKAVIEEIDRIYPINENFKKQFEEFESNIKSNIKKHNETRKVFEEVKKLLIIEIESYCEYKCNSKDERECENIKDLLENIKQTCESYIASHSVTDVFKDKKYMICKICLNQIDLLWDPKIKLYRHRKLLKSAEESLWESIKILDNESGAHLFPKNPKEIKEKFEANKEKFEQSKTWSEFMQYCRECDPYTAFQDPIVRCGLDFPLEEDHALDKFVPKVKEYKEYQQTDDDLEITQEKVKQFKAFYSESSETTQPVLFFKNLEILENLENTKNLQIAAQRVNGSMRLSFLFSLLSFLPLIPTPTQSLINKEKEKPYLTIEKTIQSEIDSLTIKDFNRLLAIAQDDLQDNHQNNYQIKVNFKDDDFGYKLKIYDCRKSHEQVVLKKQSTGFQWAFNFVFGFLYNIKSRVSFNNNIIYVMDEPATHLSVPGRKEFRKLLKEYAHKNNVTLVLATHDPFLVDTDHLDEIRIVEKEEQGSVIKNGFSYDPKENAGNNSDALHQIKRSLGVSQHVFHNPQKHRIIFVEGITDYCYLSAFKLYFNEREFKNNPIPFTFLPISGL
ncbi:ATP-binding protein [Helicobacter pylori]|nr:ATP-binding protein [Helicobacter pylori]